MITIDRLSSLSLTEQIVRQLSAAIQERRLAEGARLPSIRRLSGKLGVSTFTTVTAYDQLAALGLIVARAASGFFVAGGAGRECAAARHESVGSEGELNALWLARSALEADTAWVAAGSGLLPGHWLQGALSGSMIQKVLREQSAELFKPIPAQGLFALREALSTHLKLENIDADPASILITDGATQAIDLICHALLQPGDTVVVENPGYPMLFSRLREHGVRILAVARQRDGLDLRALEKLCATCRPKMVFTQSVLHNPTGWSSSAANLHRLLILAERHGFLIAEDDVYGDLAHGTPARLAQLSELRNVLYYSSFTKSMGPLVRLGFIAAEPARIAQLLNVKMHAVASCSGLDERIALELLQRGRYRKDIEQLRQRLNKARISTLELLSGIGVQFDAPGEGIFLWGRLPQRVDLDRLVREAYDSQILLAHGAIFDPAPVCGGGHAAPPYLRFNVGHSQHSKLSAYLSKRLGAALH